MHISQIYRYPVKGLSPHKLQEIELIPGETLPFDRIYALESGTGKFDPQDPKFLPKVNFLMLMRHEKLAALEANFDTESHVLTILRDGKQVSRGDLSSKIGRQIIEQFFAAYLKKDPKKSPKVVHADNHTFSDVAKKCLHIINLNTVRELGIKLGTELNPLRFRANIYIDDAEPWSEFNWIDKDLEINGAVLRVFARTDRCDATNVDPDTGNVI